MVEFCKENGEDNMFRFIHRNKEKFLRYDENLKYDENLNSFSMIIIDPAFCFHKEFYTMKLIYDCIIKHVPVYIIDHDLVVDKLLKKVV